MCAASKAKVSARIYVTLIPGCRLALKQKKQQRELLKPELGKLREVSSVRGVDPARAGFAQSIQE